MSYWKPQQDQEKRRVAAEDGWNLAGNNSVDGRRNRRPKRWLDDDDSSADSSFGSIDAVISSDSDELDIDEDIPKARSSRVTIEVDPLIDFIQRHSKCPKCEGDVAVEEVTTTLATSMKLYCLDQKGCGAIDYMEKPSAVDVNPGLNDNRERMTDYAVNVLYILGLLSCGDGGKEAATILGFLGLPTATSMETRSWRIIEEGISDSIRSLTKEILLENLIEEAKRTMEKSDEHDANDFDLWKSSVTGGNVVLNQRKYPKIRASHDMGWQQRGSGSSYNSPSGHALYIGAETRKPIAFDIKSKLCSICDTIRGKAGPIKDHNCCKNWTGLSGAMESKAALDMFVNLHDNYNTILSLIVADDDASTRAMLSWDNEDYLRNNNTTVVPQVPKKTGINRGQLHDQPSGVGKLPGHIPQPRFAADPNHRRKLLSGELRALEKLKVSERMTLTLMDVKRIDKNYGHFLKQCPSMSEEDRQDASKAVLEHHFDNHQHCRSWCSRKSLSEEQRKKGKQYYRCKKKDAKLYQKLHDIISRFVTKECLDDLCHGMNTQVNESFNNTFSWYAPKNKVYCGTWSLHNRLGMPIGIHSIGYEAYHRRLLTKLGIQMTPDLVHFLLVKDRYIK